jgi:hypothetical protein
MICRGINFFEYDAYGNLDIDRTAESYIDYLKIISNEGVQPTDIDDKTSSVFVVLSTPSSAHWYEKPIAGAQGSRYSHTGISFDKRMTTLYHVRSSGLIVTKRKEFEKENIAFDLYEYPVTQKQKYRMKNLVSKMIKMETKYDFLMIGKLLGKIILRKADNSSEKMSEKDVIEKQKYICSGWVAGILAATVQNFRNYLLKNKKKWTAFMPQDFVNVNGLALKRRIVFPDNSVLIDFDKEK